MKKCWKRNLVAFGFIGMLVFSTVNATAMMGGGSSSENMMGGGNSGGSMMDEGNYSGDRMPDIQRNGSNPGAVMLSKENVRDLVNQHIKSRYGEQFRMGPITDKKSYYQTEVTSQDGSLLERLLIDKGTGRIHSLR